MSARPPLTALPRDVEQLVMGWWVPRYIARPHPDLGRPGPVCPYMPASLRRGLTVAVGRPWDADAGGVPAVEDLVRDTMNRFTSWPWPEGAPAGLRAVIAVMVDMPPQHWHLIDTVHASLKTLAVDAGLMIGQFHPRCPAGAAHNPRFAVNRGPAAAIAVRDMAAHDVLFLASRRYWFDAYRRVFGSDRARTGPTGRLYRVARDHYRDPHAPDLTPEQITAVITAGPSEPSAHSPAPSNRPHPAPRDLFGGGAA